ncbi:MAG: hypothetical protein PPP56_04590 [Longimonas sp.]|uniref:hypothetical protein n=1 Tax=Longimonas sp. TaxID=2039626 RepID=UPI0033492843
MRRTQLAPLPIVLLFALTVTGGCGTDSARNAEGDVRPEPVAVTPDLTVGVMDGDAPYMFGRIGGVVADESGRIIVADTQGDVVRAYDAAGTYLFDIATGGEGPGEVSSPCCPAIGPDGDLWIRDDGNRRYTRYQVDEAGATSVGQVSMEHFAFGRWAATTFDADGHLIDVGTARGEEGFNPVRMHRSLDNETVHEQPMPAAPDGRIPTHEVSIEGGIAFIPQPHGPRRVDAHARNGDWAYTITDQYEVVRFNADGDTLRVLSRSVDGPTLTDDEYQAAEAQLRRQTERFGIQPDALSFDIPARKPPLQRIFFDADSRLWVQRTTEAGAPNEADVYDTDGTLVQVVQWPREINLHMGQITDESLYGIASSDVPQVIRMRW